jgi:hypothetical protein
MSVEFDEEIKFNNSYNKSISTSTSGLTEWMIKKGIVKTEKSAKSLMIIVTILCFALAIFIALKQ